MNQVFFVVAAQSAHLILSSATEIYIPRQAVGDARVYTLQKILFQHKRLVKL